ncbi:hypothetical protein [Escherichia phage phiWAO78-1]|nr:hypothetical protein [Escherichia phage phiWAO78-1]
MELAFATARDLSRTRSGSKVHTLRPGVLMYLTTSRVITSDFVLPSLSAAAAFDSSCCCRCVFFANSACAFCCCCETRFARPSFQPMRYW